MTLIVDTRPPEPRFADWPTRVSARYREMEEYLTLPEQQWGLTHYDVRRDGTERWWCPTDDPSTHDPVVERRPDGRFTFRRWVPSLVCEDKVGTPLDPLEAWAANDPRADRDAAARDLACCLNWKIPASAKFKIVASDCDLADIEPRQEIVTNLLAKGEVTAMAAPRGVGKTFWAMDVAAACARGSGTVLGSSDFRVTAAATVIYLQGEVGPAMSRARWDRLTGGGWEPIGWIFEPVAIQPIEVEAQFEKNGERFKTRRTEIHIEDGLEEELREVGCDLLVVDPWAMYFRGQENANEQVGAAVLELMALAKRVDCAVLIVHHITVNSSRGKYATVEDYWRGATRFADAVARQLDGTTCSPVAWDHFWDSVRSGDGMIVGLAGVRQELR